MCLGIPGQVVDIVDAEQSLAKVDVNGVRRNISVRLLADDNLRSATGCSCTSALRWPRSTSARPTMTLDQVQKMGADYVNEIDAFNCAEIV